ncbi:MAG: hypothetical protein ABI068_16665 [Ktedonobacterales bacterium]
MTNKQVSEKELIRLQIQAYEFYAGLIGRAVTSGAHEAKMPRWDDQRAVEYRELADQLRKRLAELEANDPAEANAPAIEPIPVSGDVAKIPPKPEASATAASAELDNATITAG